VVHTSKLFNNSMLVSSVFFTSFGQGMCIIGLPWYFTQINQSSVKSFGLSFILTSLTIFLLSPYIGSLIDRCSRKQFLLTLNLIGAVSTFVFCYSGNTSGFSNGLLFLIFLFTNLLFQYDIAARSALIQETYQAEELKSVNSMIEMTYQVANVLAGAVVGFLLKQQGLSATLYLTSFTFFLSWLFLLFFRYRFTLSVPPQQTSSWSRFVDGWQYMKGRKGFLLFAITATFPTVAAVMGNIITPVYIQKDLASDISIFALHETFYAIGATVAGLAGLTLMKRWNEGRNMVCHSLIFGGTFLVLAVYHNQVAFLALTLVMGWSWSLTKLLRQNILMTVADKAYMGRISTFVQTSGLLLRIPLVLLFTFTLDATGASFGYLVVSVLLLVSTLGLHLSLPALLGWSARKQRDSEPAEAQA